jgi:hypothetical protein
MGTHGVWEMHVVYGGGGVIASVGVLESMVVHD